MVEICLFNRECYRIFVKVKTSRKWKCFVQKESRSDDDYPTSPKREKAQGARYRFPSVTRQNSAIYITEQGVILERCYVSVDYLLQAYDYDRKDSSYERFLKSKLTKTYDNPLLFVIVKQNRPIITFSLASLGCQSVSNFVDKTIILR